MTPPHSSSPVRTAVSALLSKQSAAERLGVSLSTLERLMSSGELRTTHVRRRVFVHNDDLNDYIERARIAG